MISKNLLRPLQPALQVDIMDIPWAIPLQQRAGYMAQFQANDKARSATVVVVACGGNWWDS